MLSRRHIWIPAAIKYPLLMMRQTAVAYFSGMDSDLKSILFSICSNATGATEPVSCALCKGPFYRVASPSAGPDNRSPSWHNEWCAVGKVFRDEHSSLEPAPESSNVFIVSCSGIRWPGISPAPPSSLVKQVFMSTPRRRCGWVIPMPRGLSPNIIYPFHRLCLKMVHQFLGQDESVVDGIIPGREIRAIPSMAQFYEAMCGAVAVSYKSQRLSGRLLLRRSNYHDNSERSYAVAHENTNNGWKKPRCDPLNPHVLMDEICGLLHLAQHGDTHLLARKTRRSSIRSQSLTMMPQELLDNIVLFLDPKDVIALRRVNWRMYLNISLDQQFWLHFLASGGLPWLWGLDRRALAMKANSPRRGLEWDWKTLSRQLAETGHNHDKNTSLIECFRKTRFGRWNTEGNSLKRRSWNLSQPDVTKRTSPSLLFRKTIWQTCRGIRMATAMELPLQEQSPIWSSSRCKGKLKGF